MKNEKISVRFTPEYGKEQIVQWLVSVGTPLSDLSPKAVHGSFVHATEEQIIELELEISPILVTFRGKRYEFSCLNRNGEFSLLAAYDNTNSFSYDDQRTMGMQIS